MTEREATAATVVVIDGVEVSHEFWDTEKGFSHRIRVGYRTSDWVPYNGVCVFRHSEGTFAGTTEFFKGLLPSEFKIVEPVS